MKLRIVRRYKAHHIYCSNGSIINATKEDITKVLLNFKKPNIFKGNDGYWSNQISDMELAPGETLAYIDNANKLVILDEGLLKAYIKEEINYISVTEYANKHDKCRATVKNLCVAGRIPGVRKNSSGWLIPENAPYPKRKKREVKKES